MTENGSQVSCYRAGSSKTHWNTIVLSRSVASGATPSLGVRVQLLHLSPSETLRELTFSAAPPSLTLNAVRAFMAKLTKLRDDSHLDDQSFLEECKSLVLGNETSRSGFSAYWLDPPNSAIPDSLKAAKVISLAHFTPETVTYISPTPTGQSTMTRTGEGEEDPWTVLHHRGLDQELDNYLHAA